MRAARLHEYTHDMSEALSVDEIDRPTVERGDVELRTSRYDLEEANTVVERLEHREIEGRAVITL